MIICYHGTNAKNAKSINKHGFRAGTWFARHLENAIEFGGDHVFRVCFNKPPDDWQFWCHPPVPTSRIVAYSVYKVKKKFENKGLREEIFRTLPSVNLSVDVHTGS